MPGVATRQPRCCCLYICGLFVVVLVVGWRLSACEAWPNSVYRSGRFQSRYLDGGMLAKRLRTSGCMIAIANSLSPKRVVRATPRTSEVGPCSCRQPINCAPSHCCVRSVKHIILQAQRSSYSCMGMIIDAREARPNVSRSCTQEIGFHKISRKYLAAALSPSR